MFSKTTKDYQITSEIIEFENELIKFNSINFNQGLLYFYFLVNGKEYEEKNNKEKEYNKILLNKVGIKYKPLNIALLVSNDVSIKITIKTMTNFQDENSYKKVQHSPKNSKEAPISFKDRIKMFSGNMNNMGSINILRESTRPFHVKKRIEPLNETKEENNNNKKQEIIKKAESKNDNKRENLDKNIPKVQTEKNNQNEKFSKNESKKKQK